MDSLGLLSEFLQQFLGFPPEIYWSSYWNFSRDSFGFYLEFLQNSLHGSIRDFSEVSHGISSEFFREFFCSSTGNCLRFPPKFLLDFFSWVSPGNLQSSSNTSEILRSSTRNSSGVTSKNSLHSLQKFLQSSSEYFSIVSPAFSSRLPPELSSVLPEIHLDFHQQFLWISFNNS